MLACDLQPGQTTAYVLDQPAAKMLKLINRSALQVQITEVRVEPALVDRWGEYCVTLRDLSMHQKEPGYGEVGCTHKTAGEPAFAPLRWGGEGGGLGVLPGMTVYLGGYVNAPTGKDHRKTVHITVARDAAAVLAFRQPREDVIIRCNGAKDATILEPWRNTTGADLVIRGATIFAADVSKSDSVDEACIEVREAAGATRWRHCEGVNRRGQVHFAPVVVAPGEFIAGQAHNDCKSGQWDWAAYIYTCPAATCEGQTPVRR